MPRCARQKSETGIYHIMVRGINKQKIFCDKLDYEVFLKYLMEAKQKEKFKLFAYCLMGNHVHILLKDDKNILSKSMQSINIRFSQYYNRKYDRVGHVFQNRFRSETIEDLEYLTNVIEYIHDNPVKAGVAERLEYIWSSANAYLQKDFMVDSDEFYLQYSIDKEMAKQLFEKYKKSKRIYSVCDMEDDYSSQQVLMLLQDEIELVDLNSIKELNCAWRNRIIYRMYYEMNLSTKYIGELTGMKQDTIRKIVRKTEISEICIKVNGNHKVMETTSVPKTTNSRVWKRPQ